MNLPVTSCATLLAALSLLAGCQKHVPDHSVADFLRDDGLRQAELHRCSLASNPDADSNCQNVGRAMVLRSTGRFEHCYHGQQRDAACVDKAIEQIGH